MYRNLPYISLITKYTSSINGHNLYGFINNLLLESHKFKSHEKVRL